MAFRIEGKNPSHVVLGDSPLRVALDLVAYSAHRHHQISGSDWERLVRLSYDEETEAVNAQDFAAAGWTIDGEDRLVMNGVRVHARWGKVIVEDLYEGGRFEVDVDELHKHGIA